MGKTEKNKIDRELDSLERKVVGGGEKRKGNRHKRMTYETALKLKQAGYWKDRLMLWSNESEVIYPPLEELIEKCGEHFKEIKPLVFKLVDNEHIPTAWIAYGDLGEEQEKSLKFLNIKGLEGTPRAGSGYTKEEAIANLWLKLQGK